MSVCTFQEFILVDMLDYIAVQSSHVMVEYIGIGYCFITTLATKDWLKQRTTLLEVLLTRETGK